jgi:putative HNHc nuclease
VLRDQLLRDLENLNSAESAAIWARRILPAKNSLHAADARQVEEAFQARITAINGQSTSASGSDRHDEPQVQTATGEVPLAMSAVRGHVPEAIDKAELAYPEPRRIRDKEHLRFVSTQPCLICGRMPADPHHLRFAQSRALGRKVSDEWVVALCRGHHREVHRHGDERDWWEKAGIDPNVTARSLWLQSHHPTRPI